MNILVTGAAGMLGRKLIAALVRRGALCGRDIEALTIVDVLQPSVDNVLPSRRPVRSVVADLSEPGGADTLLESHPDVIFHLAAVVSSEAETDFDKGYRVNLDATRSLFEAIRKVRGAYRPRVVFTSSIAVFGQPLPEQVGDTHHLTPLTSYGTQKAIDELLLADYTRKGFLDGVGIRLPTIVIRPGKPNRAASGFFSSILREPLIGEHAVLPVSESVRHWFATPRAAVGFMLHAAELDSAVLGPVRTLNMPGLSASVGDEIEALRRAAGDAAVALIRREPDAAIAAIIESWPRSVDACRAQALGFRAETSMDEIIRVHIDDELGGTLQRH
jgi:nucleoside-diphosphate-sugar epimerase